jgi:hypothetical protein
MKRYLARSAVIVGVLIMSQIASAAKAPAKPAAKHDAAPAATAGIRVSCDGENDGAMVTINGVFKGQCPVDIQIAPGDIKLKAYQKIDTNHERAFFAEFSMAESTLKKFEVKLGPPLTPAEMQEYARSGPERARAAALALEQERNAETAKLAAAAAKQTKLENAWRKIKGTWSDVGTDHAEACTRLQDHMRRYIKQERNFRCSCEDETSTHPAHRGRVFTECKATWEANLVINGVSSFYESWNSPNRGDGTTEIFKLNEQ